jgi:hypothetical protein
MLLQEGKEQMRELAPDVGMAREQRVHLCGVARRVWAFSSWGLRGAWETSRAWIPFGAGASCAGSGGGAGGLAAVFFAIVAVAIPSAIPTQSPSLSPLPPFNSRCCPIQRVQTR